MWKENLYRPFEILLREHDDFPIGRHQHSFYEMVYILGGTGDFEATWRDVNDGCRGLLDLLMSEAKNR